MPATTRGSKRSRDASLGSLLTSLSDDHLLLIFSCFDAQMLNNFCMSCHRFLEIGSEDVLWRALLAAELGETNLPCTPPPDGRGGWRRRFLRWQRLDYGTLVAAPQQAAASAGPTARFLHRAASCLDSGRWLYVFGGRGQDQEHNDLWALDKVEAMEARHVSGGSGRQPRSRSGVDGGDHGSLGLEVAGSSAAHAADAGGGGGGGQERWRYIETVNAAPPPRQSPTLTAVGSQLLMFGGRQGDVHFLNDTWLFDPAAASWRCVRESDTLPMLPGLAWVHYQNPPRPSPRWAHSAVAFDRAVLLFGGSAPGMCFNDLHFFDSTTLQWREHVVTDGPKPAARSGHCACAVGDRMFVFGGNTTQCSFNDLWTFSTSRAVWTHVRAGGAPLGRVGHTLTLLGSRLLLLGGRDYSTNRFDPCLHAFDVRKEAWSHVPLRMAQSGDEVAEDQLTPVRTGHCATVHAGRLLIFGGLNDKNRMLDDVKAVTLIA
jgi:hypothetical protein